MSHGSLKSISHTRGHSSHYVKLLFRLGIFVFALYSYITDSQRSESYFLSGCLGNYFFWGFVWLWFVGEMLYRILPFSNKSTGCQKHLSRTYLPSGETDSLSSSKRFKDALPVGGLWLISNIVIGVLYFGGIIDSRIVLLISLFYSLLDLICVLVFCPFQTFIMKNRCCTTCRIYNWDYFLIFTPTIFIHNFFAWILLAISVFILVRWELAARKHPERFSEKSNKALSCANCEEKLCLQKKQIAEAISGKSVHAPRPSKRAVKF